MWRGILGKKLGMTQFFTEDGQRVGVTVVQAGPCPVLQVRTPERDGYAAYQLGFDDKPAKSANKAETGHAAKTGAKPARFIREFRLGKDAELKEGDVMNLEKWADVNEVQVTAKSKGKGFQGVIKRHNFSGLRATHGVKTNPRHQGSTGSLTPARCPAGVKKAGHMGDAWVTMKGLQVAKIIPERNLILLRGSVPGANGGYVIIQPAQPFVPAEV